MSAQVTPAFDVSGATTAAVSVRSVGGVGGLGGNFRCIVTSDPATLTVNCPCDLCPADFNQDGGIDGADVGDFFAKWEAGSCEGDVNMDGGVDGADVSTFFTAWEAGGC